MKRIKLFFSESWIQAEVVRTKIGFQLPKGRAILTVETEVRVQGDVYVVVFKGTNVNYLIASAYVAGFEDGKNHG